MARARLAIALAGMAVASAVCGAILAVLASVPVLFLVFRASDWLGIRLQCGGELLMAGPFLAGIGGFVFGGPCGSIAWLSRTTTGMLSRIRTIAVAAIVATVGASICYWLLVAPCATVPESTVIAGGVAVPIAVGVAAGVVAALSCLIPLVDGPE